jgi:hypothetical protein
MIAHSNTNADTDWLNQLLVCARPCFFRAAVCSNRGASGVGLWFWVCDASSTEGALNRRVRRSTCRLARLNQSIGRIHRAK